MIDNDADGAIDYDDDESMVVAQRTAPMGVTMMAMASLIAKTETARRKTCALKIIPTVSIMMAMG